MKKPQKNIERLGNNISIEKIDILSDTKKNIEEIILSIKNNHPDILIIGNGEIGDKAKAFLEKTDNIHEAGFKTTKKIILCSDVIDKCMEDRRSGSFLDRLVDSINTYYKNDSPVLIVRSSGQGDATGVGIYKSKFVENNANLITAITDVYESSFDNSAVEYRKKLGIKNDKIGIIIEPCIGDIYESRIDDEDNRLAIEYIGSLSWYKKQKIGQINFFGPQLSGWYKKHESGENEIGINGGLGLGVVSRSFDIFKSKIEEGSTLGQAIPNNRFELEHDRIEEELDEFRKLDFIPKKSKEEFLQEIGVDLKKFINEGNPILLKLKKEILSRISMYSLKDRYEKIFHNVEIPEQIKKNIFRYPLGEFIKLVQNLEGEIGNPQYLEWVAKLDGDGNFDTYITQIADQIKNTLSINLNKDSECILDCNGLINHSGLKENIKDIVFIPYHPRYNDKRLYDQQDWEHYKDHGLSLSTFMKEINTKYNNYLIIIGDKNTSGGGELDFECFSNAAGIIEYRSYGSGHEGTPASHYEGLLSSTNILFTSIRKHEDIDNMLFKLFGNNETNSDGHEVKILKIPNDKTITWAQDAKNGIGKLFLEDKEIPPKV